MKIKCVKFAQGVRCGGSHGNLEELYIDLKDERFQKKGMFDLEFNAQDTSVKVTNKQANRSFIVYPTNIAYVEVEVESSPKRANKTATH